MVAMCRPNFLLFFCVMPHRGPCLTGSDMTPENIDHQLKKCEKNLGVRCKEL